MNIFFKSALLACCLVYPLWSMDAPPSRFQSLCKARYISNDEVVALEENLSFEQISAISDAIEKMAPGQAGRYIREKIKDNNIVVKKALKLPLPFAKTSGGPLKEPAAKRLRVGYDLQDFLNIAQDKGLPKELMEAYVAKRLEANASLQAAFELVKDLTPAALLKHLYECVGKELVLKEIDAELSKFHKNENNKKYLLTLAEVALNDGAAKEDAMSFMKIAICLTNMNGNYSIQLPMDVTERFLRELIAQKITWQLVHYLAKKFIEIPQYQELFMGTLTNKIEIEGLEECAKGMITAFEKAMHLESENKTVNLPPQTPNNCVMNCVKAMSESAEWADFLEYLVIQRSCVSDENNVGVMRLDILIEELGPIWENQVIDLESLTLNLWSTLTKNGIFAQDMSIEKLNADEFFGSITSIIIDAINLDQDKAAELAKAIRLMKDKVSRKAKIARD